MTIDKENAGDYYVWRVRSTDGRHQLRRLDGSFLEFLSEEGAQCYINCLLRNDK
jgi:hypothetical protein